MRWRPPERPLWVQRLNAHADAAGGLDALLSLDADELLEQASRSTGLDDFGDGLGDGLGDWREHYDVLLEALARECDFHLAGRLVTRTELLRTLRNRLQLVELWKQRPDILEAPLDPPVFIVGSPRSGTSILLELLALDPKSRAPALWEMHHPVESLDGEALRGVADQVTTFWHLLQPEYETMHANSGDLPNECLYITCHEFLSDHWGGCHNAPSYSQYLVRSDQRPAYRFHARFLRTLQQRRRGERWLLKAPSHLFQLWALFDVYPDARIIHTHRDPLKTIPSALSLMGTLVWMRCQSSDPVATAEATCAGYATIYERQIQDRARGVLPDDHFFDVGYSALLEDPAGAIEKLYAELGWEFSDALRDEILRYLERRPRGAHGTHRYSLEEMGLDPVRERERFAFYCDHFGVVEEPGS